MEGISENHTFTPDGREGPPVWSPSEDGQHQASSTEEKDAEFYASFQEVIVDGSPMWVHKSELHHFMKPQQNQTPQQNIDPLGFIPMQVLVQQPQVPPFTITEFQVGTRKKKRDQSKTVDVHYKPLATHFVDEYGLSGTAANGLVKDFLAKLEEVANENSHFLMFYHVYAYQLLELELLLLDELKVYNRAFKSRQCSQVMKVYHTLDAEKRTRDEQTIENMYNAYCDLSYYAKSIWTTTDIYTYNRSGQFSTIYLSFHDYRAVLPEPPRY